MTNPTTPADELMPCPFCGEPARLWTNIVSPWFVQVEHKSGCPLKGQTVNYQATEAEAITAWNTRASPIQSEEVVEHLPEQVVEDFCNRIPENGLVAIPAELYAKVAERLASSIAAMPTVLLGGERG